MLARERFVCAADEVWRLQRGSDADCVFFQRAVNGGKRITDAGTRQGTWIFALDGTLLGHLNSHVTAEVRALLEGALARWDELPATARRLPEGVELVPAHRWEHSFPEGGLVLLRTARDLPAEGLAGTRLSTWNRDFAWAAHVVHQVEARQTCGEERELATRPYFEQVCVAGLRGRPTPALMPGDP